MSLMDHSKYVYLLDQINQSPHLKIVAKERKELVTFLIRSPIMGRVNKEQSFFYHFAAPFSFYFINLIVASLTGID